MHQLRNHQFPRSLPPRIRKSQYIRAGLTGREDRPTSLPSVATQVTECHTACVMYYVSKHGSNVARCDSVLILVQYLNALCVQNFHICFFLASICSCVYVFRYVDILFSNLKWDKNDYYIKKIGLKPNLLSLQESFNLKTRRKPLFFFCTRCIISLSTTNATCKVQCLRKVPEEGKNSEVFFFQCHHMSIWT
jgi:hypothetical protein